MTLDEIIRSLEDQAKDRDSSVDEDDPDCIFQRDAEALREAIKLLRPRQQVNDTKKTESILIVYYRDRNGKIVLHHGNASQKTLVELTEMAALYNRDSKKNRKNRLC